MPDVYGQRWQIVRSLGEGGQAHTFIVADLKGASDANYVLKRLKNIKRIDRFKREIELVRNLSHPNIVQLLDFDLDTDKPYLITEYCAGGSLTIAEPFWQGNPSIAFSLFLDICEALKHAHTHGVIHRDIKPANVFLRSERGPAVLGDFGLCFVETGARLTLTDEAVGPRLFIAPELEDGRADNLSNKADIYSIGKLLYWLLSGGEVFSREKHRESRWDLKRKAEDSLLGWQNIYLEHANRLLDLMITSNPEDRRRIGNITILAKRAEVLIRKEFNPISRSIAQPCLYCGQGTYRPRVENGTNVHDFGFQAIGDADWRIFTCNTCGHVQLFRVENVERREWWE